MNQENPIDELFRRKLGQSEAPVPADMWSRIQMARQPEKPARSYRLHWLWGGLLLSSLLGLGFWLAFRPTMAEVELGTFPLQEVQTETTASAAVVTQEIPSALAFGDKAGSQSISAPPAAASVVPPTATPAWSAASTEDKATLKPQNGADASIQAVRNSVLDVPEQHLSPTASGISPAQPVEKAANITPEVVAFTASEPTDQATQEEEYGRVLGPHRRRHTEVVNILPKLFFQQAPEDLSHFLQAASYSPQCASFTSNFLRFDLEVFGGPAYAHQQLAAKDSESLAHLNDRMASEKAALSCNAGLRISAISRAGLGVRMGLNYNQINERFEYMTKLERHIREILDPNTGEVIGTEIEVVEPRLAKVNNRLQMVEIPLLATYETQWKKLRIGFNLGTALNLWFNASGMLASPVDGDPISFGQVGDRDVLPIFKAQATAAVLGSVSFAYNFYQRWSLVGEPYLRSHPRAFSNPAYNLTQNYWQTGVQLGLRMRL